MERERVGLCTPAGTSVGLEQQECRGDDSTGCVLEEIWVHRVAKQFIWQWGDVCRLEEKLLCASTCLST